LIYPRKFDRISDLANNVESGTFTSSNYAVFGSLIINAKSNSKYSGTITITIKYIVNEQT